MGTTVDSVIDASGISAGIDAGVTGLAGLLASIVLGAIGFRVVRAGIRWFSTAR